MAEPVKGNKKLILASELVEQRTERSNPNNEKPVAAHIKERRTWPLVGSAVFGGATTKICQGTACRGICCFLGGRVMHSTSRQIRVLKMRTQCLRKQAGRSIAKLGLPSCHIADRFLLKNKGRTKEIAEVNTDERAR